MKDLRAQIVLSNKKEGKVLFQIKVALTNLQKLNQTITEMKTFFVQFLHF